MVIGRVVGSVVATQKNQSFVGSKMLLVQPLDLDGNDYGQEILAIDTQDAGPGDIVLVVSEGNSARQAMGKSDAPIDSVIIGVVDIVRISRRFEGR
ncbi:MAG TPA: EutN/CcmL family microcompartment protein [Firmicutes bacterium]|nr:EutN/CcmL family microcompartment protein [Bacillota bacterium]